MVRLKDVAQLANVSVATASKVLSGGVESDRISAAVCKRIRESSEELGYRPNYSARSLQSGRARAIGSLMGNANHTNASGIMWWAHINGGLLEAALQHKHQLVNVGGGGSNIAIRNAIQSLQERRIDALVIPGYLSRYAIIDEIEAAQMPVVLASGAAERALPTVDYDEVKGVYKAVDHLHALGHRRLLWISFETNAGTVDKARYQAFLDTSHSLDIESHTLALPSPEDDHTPEDSIESVCSALVKEWSKSLPEASGIIAYNEVVALGIYAAAAQVGLSIPHDLSVIAFDDLFASVAYPPMTVVSLRLHEIGVRSVELALQVAAHPEEWAKWSQHRVLVEPKVIVRKSTAPPRQ